MFYAHFVLSKKGPLARIWLAAHWDKKLTRSQVFETNITSSVEAILEPKVKLALRTSGHLLLGVVRIHSRQAKYLLSDCNEAFVKIKMAFRPGADLTEDNHRDNTALAAITLSDNMHDFESTLADINDIDPYGIAVNQSRPEDITMREEFGEPNLGRPDDDFGDSTFEDGGDRDFVVEPITIDSMDGPNEIDLHLTEELGKQDNAHGNAQSSASPSTTVVSHHHHNVFPEMPPSVGLDNNESEFGDVMDYDDDSGENLEQMFQDTVSQANNESVSGAESRLIDSTIDQNNTMVDVLELTTVPEEELSMELHDPADMTMTQLVEVPPQQTIQTLQAPARQLPQFVLPPIDRSLRENRRAPKRKRKLLIDEHKSIPSDVMKMQMQDTSEITTRLDLAPPTRKLMLWKETGNVEALFTTPGRAIPSRVLQKLFYRNMRTISVPNDAPDGLPVIPGVRRIGGFLNLDEDVIEEQEVNQLACINETAIERRAHDLSHINEVSEGGDCLEEHAMPAGACSTYSANYDCWSGGHATPHRDDDELDVGFNPMTPVRARSNIGSPRPLSSVLRLSESTSLPYAPALQLQANGAFQQHSVTAVDQNMFYDSDNVQIKPSLSSAATAAVAGSAAFDQSALPDEINQFSTGQQDISMGTGLSFSSNITDGTQSVERIRKDMSNLGSGYSDSLSGAALNNSLDITMGSEFLPNELLSNEAETQLNKLQTAMVTLDQQLDKINEEYPVEITQEGLEKRSEIMLSVLKNAINQEGKVDFHHLTVSNNKKQAASKFYTLLLLGKQKKLEMFQENPYSNIIITHVACDG